jgi:hypothetical protein
MDKRNNSHAIGLSGEFPVAAEMAWLGWEVVHTPRNYPGYDLLALKDGRMVGIRVKTASDSTIKWTAKEDSLLAQYTPGRAEDWTAMVLFANGNIRGASIYVVPTDLVVDAVERDHSFYVSHPKRDGTSRKLTDLRLMRFFGEDQPTNTTYGYDKKFGEYLNGWHLLEKASPPRPGVCTPQPRHRQHAQRR